MCILSKAGDLDSYYSYLIKYLRIAKYIILFAYKCDYISARSAQILLMLIILVVSTFPKIISYSCLQSFYRIINSVNFSNEFVAVRLIWNIITP